MHDLVDGIIMSHDLAALEGFWLDLAEAALDDGLGLMGDTGALVADDAVSREDLRIAGPEAEAGQEIR